MVVLEINHFVIVIYYEIVLEGLDLKKRVFFGMFLIVVMLFSGCDVSKNDDASAKMNEGIHLETKTNNEMIEILGEATSVDIYYPQIADMKNRKIKNLVNESLHQYFMKQTEFLRNNENVLYSDFNQTYLDDEYLSLIFKYGLKSNESNNEDHKLFVSVNVDLTTGLFENWDDFISMFGTKFTEQDRLLLSSAIDELKTEHQINVFAQAFLDKKKNNDLSSDVMDKQNTIEDITNIGFYRDIAGITIFYYDGYMQEIHIPKDRIPFMFKNMATKSEN